MDIGKELGVQSYCFRHFKENPKVIEEVKKCGVAAIELCGAHADFADESKFDDVIGLYKKSGVRIVAIGVQGFKNSEAAERKYFEFAKRAGAKYISADFALEAVPACYRTAEKLADKYDVKLAIHNHGGRHWLGTAHMLRNVFGQTSERIGLCLDTAWALDSGENPVKMIEEFGRRLYGLHVKDFVFDRARKPEDVVVGTGNLNLAALVAALKKVDFSGYAVLEYEGDVENPTPAVTKCVKAVRAAKAAG
jgi:sugar phosphate isomerase/epimerase